MVLLKSYLDNLVWFVFWEEATEFLYVAGVALTLRIFSASLLPRR